MRLNPKQYLCPRLTSDNMKSREPNFHEIDLVSAFMDRCRMHQPKGYGQKIIPGPFDRAGLLMCGTVQLWLGESVATNRSYAMIKGLLVQLSQQRGVTSVFIPQMIQATANAHESFLGRRLDLIVVP